MSKKFKKQELERLGCSKDEISLVIDYQKKLPILSDNDDVKGFCINARDLHTQLCVKKKFATWIKSNLKDYTEFVDFITGSPRETGEKLTKFNVDIDYHLTIELAKEIAMFTGRNSQASNDLKEISRMVRRYFILMERIVTDNKEWLAIRDPEKVEYKNMCSEIDAWNFRIWHKKAGRADYVAEADGINMIVIGKKSQELKLEYGCPTNELLRDYLKKDHNEELLFLERQNQVLLRMDMGYTERMTLLAKMHEVTFKNKSSERVA